MLYYSPYLLILCFFHVLIWFIVMTAAFFSNYFAIINIFIIIPIIFIIQSFLKFHPFVISKMKYITTNIDKFSNVNNLYLSDLEKIDIQRIAIELNKTNDETLKAFLIMKNHEHYFILPKIIDYLKELFDSSFRNPFESSGIIIISLFINVILSYK
jgi:hypothetical protein